MAVVDLRGGILPNPVLNDGRPAPKDPPKDLIDQIEDDTIRSVRLGNKLRTLEKYGVMANPQSNQPALAPAENTRVDVAGIVASQNKLVSDLITQLSSKGSDNNPLLSYLLEDLRETKSKLEGSDPMAAITQSMQMQAVMKDLLKKDLGIGQSGVVGGDIHAMIELEKIKTDSSERMFQWKTEFETKLEQWKQDGDERRRRWAVEDEERKAEREERRAEKDFEHKKSDTRAAMFEDIVKPLAESINFGGGEEAGVAEQPVSEAPKEHAAVPHNNSKGHMFRAKKFKCNCGELIDIPEENIFSCPKCGMEYEMGPMDSK